MNNTLWLKVEQEEVQGTNRIPAAASKIIQNHCRMYSIQYKSIHFVGEQPVLKL